MAPTTVVPVQRADGRRPARAPKSFVRNVYEGVTSSENASVMKSMAMFGGAVAFLSSSWAELLLPPA